MSDQKYEHVTHSKKRIAVNNFIGGIAWAFGATIGFSFFLGILGFIASNVNFIPVIGEFVAGIVEFVQNTRSPQ